MNLLDIILVIILLSLSALASATETAFTASAIGKLHKLKADGNKFAKEVLKMLKHKSKVISSLLIANSVVNILATSLVTAIFLELFGESGTGIAAVVMSVAIIVFGEVLPKAIAIAFPEKFVVTIAPGLKLVVKILSPFTWCLDKLILIVTKLLRLSNLPTVNPAEEIRGLIEQQHEEGQFIKTDRDMLGGLLDLHSVLVKDIMVHRSRVFTLDVDLGVKEILERSLEATYSRIPIWQGDPENIIGILHIRSLAKALYECNYKYENVKISQYLSDPMYIPDNANIKVQLDVFRSTKNHFGIVVNEYGEIQGILTLEDVLEEVVGQIEDEHDKEVLGILQKGDRIFVRGDVTIRDLNRELNWHLPDDEASTIGGLVINELGRIPEQGEKISIYNLKIAIIKVANGSIKKLRLEPLEGSHHSA